MKKDGARGRRPRLVLLRSISRLDVQVSIFAGAVAVLSCYAIFLIAYHLTYQDMLRSLEVRGQSIHSYVEVFLEAGTFQSINTPQDMDTPLYLGAHDGLYRTKVATGVEYLYTAKRAQDGRFVYVVDGLSLDSPDFRRPGDAIEGEIVAELERALAGEEVWPEDIKDTDWGRIFIAYLPVHADGQVVGVVGIEFDAQRQFDTYRRLRLVTPVVALCACLLAALCAVKLFRRISNPSYRDLSNTDRLTQLKSRNAYEVDVANLEAMCRCQGVGLCLIDLNNLKHVNDTMGHWAGDEYLRCAARVVREQAPQGAGIYRVGGDEIAVMTQERDLEQLRAWQDRVCAVFLRERPEWKVDMSLSAGCAVFEPGRDACLADVYRRADQLMYTQKKAHHLQERE